MKRIQLYLTGVGMLAVASALMLRPSAIQCVIPAPVVEETEPLSGIAHPSNGEIAARRDSTGRVERAVDLGLAGTSIAPSQSEMQSRRTAVQPGPARMSPAPIKRQSIRPESPHSRKASLGIIHDDPLASTSVARIGAPDGSSQETLGIKSDSPPVLQPAALIEIDDPAVSQVDAQKRLTKLASDFTSTLAQSGLDPADPGYRQLWDRERANADARFRSMYGGQAWMNHHIQSHHAQFRSPTQ
jgi:hypothetical protein